MYPSAPHMDPLTIKELQYLSDLSSGEDMLVRQALFAASCTQSPDVRQACAQLALRHRQHGEQLAQLIAQHLYMSH